MITKYTKCEVIEVKNADERIEGNAKLSSFDHIPADTYRTDDGYVYVKVRAISSRVNKNFDGWPVNELAGMDEGEYRKITSSFEKEAGSTLRQWEKLVKKRGFYIESTGPHNKIFHEKYPRNNFVGYSKTPRTGEEELTDNTSKKLVKQFPDEMRNFVFRGKNYYPYQGSEKEVENEKESSFVNNTLTFTKDSAIKSKGDYGFRTFIGRPIFIDHNNSDPQKTRGVIVDAMLHIEPSHKTSSDSYWSDAPTNHKPETWIELLLEVDAKSFPKLAKALTDGKVNAVSMGCNVEYTLCSVCNNKAANVEEYCDHIKKKGTTFKTGNTSKLAYEDCYNINFFEISAVFDPADVTALFTEPVKTSNVKTSTIEDSKLLDEKNNKNFSLQDYAFLLNDDINKNSYRLKDANHETKQLETNLKSSSVNKQADFITAPNKVDTLKTEKPCPIGLAGECGLDDESGRCEKCGFREPPSPLDDPDLSKAKDFDRQKEEQKDETRDETKELIDQLKKALSKNEKRSVNSKMNENTKITLTANIEEVPSDERLAELGWIVPEKEAGVASNTVPVAEDGQPASDRPKEQKVISDQTKPVESAAKVALGELPQISQPNGGDASPQYKGDKNNETSGISEHQPGTQAEQYQSVKKEVDEPQYADEGYTQDIKTHNPSTMPEQYQKVKKVVDKPQYSDEPGTSGISEHHAELHKSKVESPVLAAIKLADLEVELGLNDAEMKYARVAELENEDLTIVQAKYETLSKIKEAGLTKKEASSMKLASFPSLKGVKESSVTSSTSGGVPDDAIFG